MKHNASCEKPVTTSQKSPSQTLYWALNKSLKLEWIHRKLSAFMGLNNACVYIKQVFRRYVLQILHGHFSSLHFFISLLKFSRDDTNLILPEIKSCARVYSLIKRLWPRCFLVIDLKTSLRKRFCSKSLSFLQVKWLEVSKVIDLYLFVQKYRSLRVTTNHAEVWRFPLPDIL